jgi:hypothetical protein
MAKEIAYMDLSKGKTDETIRNDVQKQAGAFLYNVQQQYAEGMAVERKSNQNNYSTPVNDIKYEYHLLNAEAKKMGVDVYDTTVAQAAKDSFLLKMRNTLSSASYTPDQINTLLDQLGATYDSDVKASIIGSWDSFNFTVQLNNDVQNIISTNHGEHVSAQVQSDTQRTTALSYIQNNLHDLLNVNIDTTTFNALLPDYSPNGKYNVNDEIDPEDFPKLFSFDYNRLAGASFASINLSDIGIDVNNLVSGPDGNYDPKLKLTETLPFDTYSGGYGGEYRQGEFLPGYTLHCKILQKDVTDSHICSLQILLGVSDTNDKDPNDVT